MAKSLDIKIEEKRDEILIAFYKLFESMEFHNITIKRIGEETKFTRTTIYNYFKSIDEIFMAAYQKEYYAWNDALQSIMNDNETLSTEEFAQKIAESLVSRENLLRLTTVNFHERESNCRREFVFSNKAAFAAVVQTFHDCIEKFYKDKNEEEIIEVMYMFFPFLHGMYRYINVSPLQKEAISSSGLLLQNGTIYELTYNIVKKILS